MATSTKKQAARTLGETGEQVAADWYRAAGYSIIDRNWRCFEGELDIIARRGDLIAICEVKARTSSRFIDPALAVGPAKQDKIRTAALRWIAENAALARLRFDVALVVAGTIQVIEGAF